MGPAEPRRGAPVEEQGQHAAAVEIGKGLRRGALMGAGCVICSKSHRSNEAVLRRPQFP